MRGVSLWQLRHGAAATTRAAAGYTSTATASRASTACRAAAAAASRRSMATKPSSRPPPGPKKPPPFPTVPTCPSPTCGCADTPAGLDIDHKSPLNGVMTGYAEHVLVCTGQDDWASRIEEENGGDNLAADLKELFGRGGEYTDALQPFHNVSVLNSSFPPSVPPRPEVQNSSAYLLPSFKYIPYLPRVSFDAVRAMAKAYILPEKLHPMHDGLSPVHRDRLLREPAYAHLLPGVTDVDEVLVLICGHGGRDERCSIMGQVLRREFEDKLASVAGLDVRKGPVTPGAGLTTPNGEQQVEEEQDLGARVGLISHIGGHKFAGNVIVYLPPGLVVDEDGAPHPLAGHGIWYGRVEPRHVEGIIEETIVNGNVVEDIFRGGIDSNRKLLRI